MAENMLERIQFHAILSRKIMKITIIKTRIFDLLTDFSDR